MEETGRRIETMVFRDRAEAGRALAEGIVKRGMAFGAVLGLTRGGVPVAYEVASALGVPLDIVVVKKLRAPMNEELAIGAAVADGTKVIRQDIIRQLGVSEKAIAEETRDRLAEAHRVESAYRGGNPSLDLKGKAVLVVDDGIATGASMEAAVLSAKHRGASPVVVGTPVASAKACRALRKVADDVFCLTKPVDFWAVGQFYMQFQQTLDEEVSRLLTENRKMVANSR